MNTSRKQPPVNNDQYNSTMTSLKLYFYHEPLLNISGAKDGSVTKFGLSFIILLKLYFYHEPLLNFSGPKDGSVTKFGLSFIIMSYLIFSMF